MHFTLKKAYAKNALFYAAFMQLIFIFFAVINAVNTHYTGFAR